MKIAVIGARGIPAKFGGIERYCQELYPQIVARGHQVDLYVQPSYQHQSWFSSFIYQKMKVIALPSLPGKRLSLLNSALNTIWATFGKYDVIHLHGIAAAWFAWFPQMFGEASIIMTCHQLESADIRAYRIFRCLLPWLEQMAVKYTDEIIVTSPELTSYFWRKYGVCPQYIPNAPAKYTVSENNHSCLRAFNLDKSQYLLYLGTFEPDQRLDLLIEVFQKLQPHNWKLVLAGDISYSYQYGSKLLQMTRQQHNIIFTGEIGGNFLGELVRGADIFVNPSNGNNLCSSVAMLEAMREGVPIVASDTENHRQLIGRDRGLLFRAGQFDSLLIQLKYAMSRPKLLLAMAKKAQTYIAVNHNWDKVIYKNLFLYLQLTTKITLQPSPQT
ncbi:MAG: glycosyltransferase family 4 protein, partial [Cyanobacteria bacterium P01_C01_bin.72]